MTQQNPKSGIRDKKTSCWFDPSKGFSPVRMATFMKRRAEDTFLDQKYQGFILLEEKLIENRNLAITYGCRQSGQSDHIRPINRI
jgi:hypothetical protein